MRIEKNTVDPRHIEQMFDSIAHRYDLLNRILSLGIDVRWRKKLIKLVNLRSEEILLDLATGSGDILKQFHKAGGRKGIGCDRSEKMLRFARNKLIANNFPPMLVRGDAFRLPFKNESIDAVTIGFGIRNMHTRTNAMIEIHRILKTSGKLAILEFFPAQTGIRGRLYKWYARRIIPLVGKMISGNKSAYSYLPDSIRDFPDTGEFREEMKNCGFYVAETGQLTFGIVSILIGSKK